MKFNKNYIFRNTFYTEATLNGLDAIEKQKHEYTEKYKEMYKLKFVVHEDKSKGLCMITYFYKL